MFRDVKRGMRIGVAVAAVAVLTQCSSDVQGTPTPAKDAPEIERADVEAWLGEWTGPITQAGAQPYTVVLNLEHNGNTVIGTVDYPQLQCAGTLGDAELRGDRLSIVETTTTGVEHCVTPIDLTLTLKPGAVHYHFDDQGGGDGDLHQTLTNS